MAWTSVVGVRNNRGELALQPRDCTGVTSRPQTCTLAANGLYGTQCWHSCSMYRNMRPNQKHVCVCQNTLAVRTKETHLVGPDPSRLTKAPAPTGRRRDRRNIAISESKKAGAHQKRAPADFPREGEGVGWVTQSRPRCPEPPVHLVSQLWCPCSTHGRPVQEGVCVDRRGENCPV